MNKGDHSEAGASLIELMVVLFIVAIAVTTSLPLLQKQIAIREIDFVARRLIAHAHFARGQALRLGESVMLAPRSNGQWDSGWNILSGCVENSTQTNCYPKIWLSHPKTDPIFFKGGAKSFVDPHHGGVGIVFNGAGAARTAHGGFVANRLILRHQRVLNLERQLILGSGGRWRICDPDQDARRCH